MVDNGTQRFPLPDDIATFLSVGSLITGLVCHPQEHRCALSVVPALWRWTTPISQSVTPFRLTVPISEKCTAHRGSPQNFRAHVLSSFWPRDPHTQRSHPAFLLRSGAPPSPTAPLSHPRASQGGPLPAAPTTRSRCWACALPAAPRPHPRAPHGCTPPAISPTWSRSGACAPPASPCPLPGTRVVVPPCHTPRGPNRSGNEVCATAPHRSEESPWPEVVAVVAPSAFRTSSFVALRLHVHRVPLPRAGRAIVLLCSLIGGADAQPCVLARWDLTRLWLFLRLAYRSDVFPVCVVF